MNSTTERIDKELKDYINKIMEICKKQGLDVPETDVIVRNQKIEKAQKE